MALTGLKERKALPGAKDYKLADAGGLYLYVTRSGFKSWRLKYRFGEQEKRMVIGPYPEITLAKAREERDRARALLREYRDPALEELKKKRAAFAAAATTFERVATEWHELQSARWSPVQIKKVIQALRRDVFPAIGTLPIAEIDGRSILVMLRKVEARGSTKLASRLLALTAVRPGVVRAARWDEIEGIDWSDEQVELDTAVWRIPPARMKLELAEKGDEAFEHVVPLAPQAVEVLRAVRKLSGRFAFLFPSIRSTRMPMSENAIGYMYLRNGYSGRHVPHGWRATFSTIMNERAAANRRPEDRAIIDTMLAHRPKGLSASEMAYNRAEYM